MEIRCVRSSGVELRARLNWHRVALFEFKVLIWATVKVGSDPDLIGRRSKDPMIVGRKEGGISGATLGEQMGARTEKEM